MDTDRAIARWSNMLQRAVALCFLAAGLSLSGCRGPGSPEEITVPARFTLVTGDRLVYDGWVLDALGFLVDSTRTRCTWDVVSTAASGGGYSNAIMVREEILRVSTSRVTADTFYLRLTPGGSVLRYSFLADLVRRREGRTIPRRWDTLSVSDVQSWAVGALDSAGQIREGASVIGDNDYFNVQVDSVSFIFAARRIDMEGETLQYTLWISTAPSCFPRLEEAPDPLNNIATGSLLLLRELRLAPR